MAKTVVRENLDTILKVTKVETMPAWKIILVRASRVYFQSLLGFLVTFGIGLESTVGVEIDVFSSKLITAASLAVAPTVVSLIMNLVEILTNLDITHPGMRA